MECDNEIAVFVLYLQQQWGKLLFSGIHLNTLTNPTQAKPENCCHKHKAQKLQYNEVSYTLNLTKQ